MQDNFVSPLLEIQKTFGTDYKNQIVEMTKKIQDSFVSPLLEIQKTFGTDYKNQIVEMTKKMQDSFSSPLLEIQKTFGTDYKNQIVEMTKKIQDSFSSPFLEIQKTFGTDYKNQIVEMTKKIQDSFVSPLLEIQKTLGTDYKNQIIEMTKNVQYSYGLMNPLLDIKKAITSSLFAQIHKEDISLAKIASNLSSISNTILVFPKEEIIINNDQSITCGSEFITIDALQDIVQQILLNVESKEDNFFQGIVNEIRKLKKPFHEKIMTWLIMPLLISFLTILFTPAINQLYDDHFVQYKVRIKQIKKEISQTEFNFNMLEKYRLVSGRKLDVRERSCRKSKLIGIIYFGQIVKVIKRKKNWTLIEWKNSEEPFELMLRGWVFNRYLEKLNRN